MPAPNPAVMEVGKLSIDPVMVDGTGQRVGPRLYTLTSSGAVAEFMPAVGTVAPLVSPLEPTVTLNPANLQDGSFYEYSGPAVTVTMNTSHTVQETTIYTTTNPVTFAGSIIYTGSGGPILPGGCVMTMKKLTSGVYLLFGDMAT